MVSTVDSYTVDALGSNLVMASTLVVWSMMIAWEIQQVSSSTPAGFYGLRLSYFDLLQNPCSIVTQKNKKLLGMRINCLAHQEWKAPGFPGNWFWWVGSVVYRSLINSEDCCTVCSATTTKVSEVLLCRHQKKKSYQKIEEMSRFYI